MNINCYEVRVIDGVQFLFYKGEKLPGQMKTIIVQDMDMRNYCEATVTVRALLVDTINVEKPIPPPIQIIREGENPYPKYEKIKSPCCNADIWGEGGHQCERIHICSKCKKKIALYINQAEPPPPPPPPKPN